jgi:hypothetical protein
MSRRLLCWLASPAKIDDLKNIGPGYASRLREAGVITPTDLFVIATDGEELKKLSDKTGLSLQLLQDAVNSARRPWFQNYKITGILGLFFGAIGVLAALLQVKSWIEARQFQQEQQLAVPVWELSLNLTFVDLPLPTFDMFWDKVMASKDLYANSRDDQRNEGKMDTEIKKYFLLRAFSYHAQQTNEVFYGNFTMLLPPELRLFTVPCDFNVTPDCIPQFQLFSNTAQINPERYLVWFEQMTNPPTPSPLHVELRFHPKELPPFDRRPEELTARQFRSSPDLQYCIDTNAHRVPAPHDVVESALQTVPRRMNMSIKLNDSSDLIFAYLFARSEKPVFTGSKWCFDYQTTRTETE